jgi:hypothetical protein
MLLAFVGAVVLTIPAAHAQRSSQAKKIVRSSSVRWPKIPGRSRYSVIPFTAPTGIIQRGDIYVNRFRVNSSFKNPSDWIVACAHRGPAFASGTLHHATGTIYALIVLTTGQCFGGDPVAGTLARAKVVVTYK